jgi:Tol biopolymer transport system component
VNGSGRGSALVQRRIPAGPTITGDATPSPDGRFLAYVDWNTGGNVAIHDLSSGREYDLTQDTNSRGNDYADALAFTPDSRHIIYQWSVDRGDKTEIRIIDIDGSGKRTILSDSKYPYEYVEPSAVSPDGKVIAAGLWFEDKTAKIALVSVDTGNVRILRSVEWHNPALGNFSPDGRWLVYNSALRQGSPTTAASQDAEIYAIATDGSALVKLVPGPVRRSISPQFTPDGSRIVFIVGRAGGNELWSMAVANGKKVDDPRLEMQKEWLFPLGFARDGTFYFYRSEPERGIFVAEVDPVTMKVKISPRLASNRLRSAEVAAPNWSPDGTLLSYVSGASASATANDPTTLVIQDVASGEERETTFRGNFRGWFDNTSILVNNGGTPHVVDVNDGKDSVLIEESIGGRALTSRDKRAFFHFTKNTPLVDTISLMRRDLETRQEKEVFRVETKGRQGASAVNLLLLSPDNQWVVFGVAPAGGARQSVMLVSSSGGTPREIHFPKEQRNAGTIAWTPDSKGLMFVEPSDSGMEIWVQPLDGAPAYATGVARPAITSISMSSDSRHIAFLSSANENQEGQSGVWAVENLFVNTRPPKK